MSVIKLAKTVTPLEIEDAKALEQASCYDSILPIMVEPGGWQLPARAFERGMRLPWPFLMKSKAPGSKDSEVS